LIASVFSSPFSILHLQVPHSPPPHLNGMPPFSRIEMRSRLPLSGTVTALLALVMKVTVIGIRA
jgi:hypothetical protein